MSKHYPKEQIKNKGQAWGYRRAMQAAEANRLKYSSVDPCTGG
jgi:hypothetical protein